MSNTVPQATTSNAFGGSTDALSYPLEDDNQIETMDEVEPAMDYANAAMEAAAALEAMLEDGAINASSKKLINVAVENYVEQFGIPTSALESDDPAEPDTGKQEAGKLKKVILYLYAIVERIFKAIFDYFRNQKLVARRVMPRARHYIGLADSLIPSRALQLRVRDRSLAMALQLNGIAPLKTVELFDQLAEAFERQYKYSPVNEVIHVIGAAKEGNSDRLISEANKLRDKLEAGLRSSLKPIEPHTLSIFSEKKTEGTQFFASDALFGQNYIFGIISDAVRENGTFTFRCGIRRDAEVPLRAAGLPCLAPDEIRHICRTAIGICENIIRFSRDEELMQKALREASFLTTKEADKASVAALKNVSIAGQNSYIVYLRFTTRTMQALMRWCAASIRRYEELEK